MNSMLRLILALAASTVLSVPAALAATGGTRDLIVEMAVDHNPSSASINWGGQVTQSGPEGNRSSGNGWSVGTDSQEAQQALRVLDNHAGYIALSESRPLPWRLYEPDGRVIVGAREREAVHGLYVRPHLLGNGRVQVDVAVKDGAFNGGRLRSTELATSASGRLGEWITLGTIGPDNNGSEWMTLGSRVRQEAGTRQIRVRVRRAGS